MFFLDKVQVLMGGGQSRPKFLHTISCLCDAAKKGGSEITQSEQPQAPRAPDNRILGGLKGIPTALDKKFLVWSGRFKSADEIPRMIDADIIHSARSWGRIRINITLLILTGFGGMLMVYMGKRAAARGESVHEQNLEWHRQVREDYEKNKK